MSNIKETESQMQIDIPLTEEGKLKYSKEMLEAMTVMARAASDMSDYKEEKKEEMAKIDAKIADVRLKLEDQGLAKSTRISLTQEIIDGMNQIRDIERDKGVYFTEKKAEIAKSEAIMEIARSRISRGKDVAWLDIKVIRDFDKRIKTFVRKDTGEVFKTLPLTNDDLQSTLDV